MPELPEDLPDGARMLADARELAFPRYPGTEGDRRAIEIVRRQFGDAGLDVEEQEFSYDIRVAFRAIRVVLLTSATLVLAAGWTAYQQPLAGAVLLAACALLGGMLVIWAPGAERLYARPGPTVTRNVTGRRPGTKGVPRLRLILLAHHDSKSQNLSFPWRMGMTLGSLLGILGLVLVLASGTARSNLLAPALGSAAALCLGVLSTLSSGNRSPGGVDNAGSVAILFELARRLPAAVPDDVELIFLSTGAEEDHMVGAMRWLERHTAGFEGTPTFAINIDGAGAPGRAVLLERYGLGRLFSARLSGATRVTSRQLGIPYRGILMLPAMGIDAIPFAHRGIDCVTFSSGALDRATISVHSPRDVADHLDEETLVRVTRLVEGVVHNMIAPAV